MGALREELEGTKQSLEKAKEENGLLAFCVQSLTDELERTKIELQKLKPPPHQNHQLSPVPPIMPLPIHPDVDEDLKFVENEKQSSSSNNNNDNDNNAEIKGPTTMTTSFQKNKRYVKFASPPELNRIIVGKAADEVGVAAQTPSPPASVKRPKKKTAVPLIGWLFAQRKGNREA